MPGLDPITAAMSAGGNAYPTMQSASGAAPPNDTHWPFLFWLVVIGVLLPVAILGGLQVGGFSFVFRHR